MRSKEKSPPDKGDLGGLESLKNPPFEFPPLSGGKGRLSPPGIEDP